MLLREIGALFAATESKNSEIFVRRVTQSEKLWNHLKLHLIVT
nr:MAG TPA: hypothetical protein [Caudoviricetes sp.]